MCRLILIAAISLSALSCAHPPAVPYLPLPPRPSTPTVTADELDCLAADVYRRLVIRERLRDAYIDELQAIIKATR